MKASETKLQEVMGNSYQQFIVPLFQRTYSWTKKEWQELWNDLLELYETKEPKEHFVGSIVTIPMEKNTYSESTKQHLLIDGQQRLTTLAILLMAIRDKTVDDSRIEEINNNYLINKYPQKHYKLRPTQEDRIIFEQLIEKSEMSDDSENTRVVQCYRFFETRLKKKDIDPNKLFKVIVGRLSVVKIDLDPTDNPHMIFESLNARGKPLTQADLIRNHFLMNTPSEKQQEIFDEYWKPMQEALNDELTEFMRHYLIARTSAFIKKNEIYISMKKFIEIKEGVTNKSEAFNHILNHLKDLATYAKYYQKILFPIFEHSLAIHQALKRITHIEITTAYPLLLSCYHDYKQETLTQNDFCVILHLIENLIIRRTVCNMPREGLNKIFPSIHREVKENFPYDFTSGVASILQKKIYPKDDEFRQALVSNNIYAKAGKFKIIKLILWSIERKLNYSNNYVADFDQLHIDSVMPEKIKNVDWWREHLGADWEIEHELFVNILGNFTLTETKLSSQASFPEKQALLKHSNLELNRYFFNVSQWKPEQIKQRAAKLAEIALQIWSYFGEKKSIPSQIDEDDVTSTDPCYLLIENEEFEVKTWKDVLVKTLTFLIKESPDIFENIASDYPKFVNKNEIMLHRPYHLSNGYYVETNLSANNIYQFCKQIASYAGFSQDDWQVDYK